MPSLSQTVIFLAGAWLIGVGVFMLLQPRQALATLARMGSSPAIHFGEMAARFATGGLLVLFAADTRAPTAITIIGAFLMISAVVLALLPRRWHSAYSIWWLRRIPVGAVRFFGPISWIMGAALIWTAL